MNSTSIAFTAGPIAVTIVGASPAAIGAAAMIVGVAAAYAIVCVGRAMCQARERPFALSLSDRSR